MQGYVREEETEMTLLFYIVFLALQT